MSFDEAATDFCPECSYDLRSISESRCPECGFRFDRPALQTLKQNWPAARQEELLMAIGAQLFACTASVMILTYLSRPAWPAYRLFGLVFGGALVIVFWIIVTGTIDVMVQGGATSRMHRPMELPPGTGYFLAAVATIGAFNMRLLSVLLPLGAVIFGISVLLIFGRGRRLWLNGEQMAAQRWTLRTMAMVEMAMLLVTSGVAVVGAISFAY